jgi:hypothetical protein
MFDLGTTFDYGLPFKAFGLAFVHGDERFVAAILCKIEWMDRRCEEER